MNSPDNFAVALANAEMGFASIPCHYGSKVPLVKWKPFQMEIPSHDLLRRWFKRTRVNISIVTSGMVLFDVDDMA